jgi:hypothetical protein
VRRDELLNKFSNLTKAFLQWSSFCGEAVMVSDIFGFSLFPAKAGTLTDSVMEIQKSYRFFGVGNTTQNIPSRGSYPAVLYGEYISCAEDVPLRKARQAGRNIGQPIGRQATRLEDTNIVQRHTADFCQA